MTLDLYQLCPCGTGKKIKFCCKDIVGELSAISRAIEGQQFEAALVRLEEAIAQHPNRASLWTLKCTVLWQTRQNEVAAQAVSEYLAFAPDNPIALSMSAIVDIVAASDSADILSDQERDQGLQRATGALHQALANSPSPVPVQVVSSLSMVAQALLAGEYALAGHEHLLLACSGPDGSQSPAYSTLNNFNRSRDIPILFKQELVLPQPVDWVHWKDDYVAALQLAHKGGWTQAAEIVERLIREHEPHNVLLDAHAVLRCRIPDHQQAAAALHDFAAHKDTPLDDAVEAIALAELIAPTPSQQSIDLVRAVLSIENADRALEHLQSDPRATLLEIDFSRLAADDQPPPKSGFTLLDRPLPNNCDGLATDDVPEAQCELFLFGKQTDRDARLELIVAETRLPAITQLVNEIIPDQLTGEPTTETIDVLQPSEDVMTIRPVFPKDATVTFRQACILARYRRLLLETWTDFPHPALDEMTPAEASKDPDHHRRLLGLILALQVMPSSPSDESIYNEQRKQLGLPNPEPIQGVVGSSRFLPLVRLSRLVPESLSDEDLQLCFLRASQVGAHAAVLSLGGELVKRDEVSQKIGAGHVYGAMAQSAQEPQQRLELLKAAQDDATKHGESPGIWMVAEFTHRLLQGEAEEAQQLLAVIQSKHLHEPNVGPMLMQTLQQFGLVGPDGRLVQQGGHPSEPPASAQSSGKLWTPETANEFSPSSAPTEQSGPSKLWVPD